MTNQRLISPPAETIRQWEAEWDTNGAAHCDKALYIAARAAQYGADQELKACCDHIRDYQWGFVDRPDGTKMHRAVDLEFARRPKPPSLKEQALDQLRSIEIDLTKFEMGVGTTAIRRALESLPD
jgi:hypothetical protein